MQDTAANWLTSKRIGALLFLALSVFYGAQIPDIQQLPVDALEVMNARSLPWLLSGLGVVFSLLLFVFGGRSSLQVGVSVVAEAAAPPRAFADRLVAALLLVWTAVFGVLLTLLGLWLATAVFLLGGFALLGEPVARRSVLVALTVATVLWGLLTFGLGLYLPPGSLWSGISFV